MLAIARQYIDNGEYDMAISLLSHAKDNAEQCAALLMECCRAKEAAAKEVTPPAPPVPPIVSRDQPSDTITVPAAEPTRNGFFSRLNLPLLFLLYVIADHSVGILFGIMGGPNALTSIVPLVSETFLALSIGATVDKGNGLRALLMGGIAFGAVLFAIANVIMYISYSEYLYDSFNWSALFCVIGNLLCIAVFVLAAFRGNRAYRAGLLCLAVSSLFGLVWNVLLLMGELESLYSGAYAIAWAILSTSCSCISFAVFMSAALQRGRARDESRCVLTPASLQHAMPLRIGGWIAFAGVVLCGILAMLVNIRVVAMYQYLIILKSTFIFVGICLLSAIVSLVLLSRMCQKNGVKVAIYIVAGLTAASCLILASLWPMLKNETASFISFIFLIFCMITAGLFWYIKVYAVGSLRRWASQGVVVSLLVFVAMMYSYYVQNTEWRVYDIWGESRLYTSEMLAPFYYLIPFGYLFITLARPGKKLWPGAVTTIALGAVAVITVFLITVR